MTTAAFSPAITPAKTSAATPLATSSTERAFEDFIAKKENVDRVMAPVYEHGDRMTKWVVLGHCFVALALAPFYATWALSFIVAAAAVSMFFVSVKVLPRHRVTRIIAGIVLQTFVALHIYQLHGQPEMHFFFFTAFTAMIVYQDGLSMWPGTVLIILQHILFALLQNSGVRVSFFPEDYVGVQKLFFHFGIAIIQVVICNVWCHFARRRTLLDAYQRGALAEATAKTEAVNVSLEKQVTARTVELQEALADLWSEMALAHKIQTVLLPADGKYGNYEVSAKMKPAEQVGGDYYDVFDLHGQVWVLIGDVSGHGVSAGLVMMMVQTAVRSVVASAARQGRDLTPSALLAAVNATIASKMQHFGNGTYMTITAMRLDGAKVQYAGLHDAPLVYRGGSKVVEMLESQGVWLGLIDDIGPLLEDKTFELAHDDVLVLYTDGLIEARRDGNDLLGIDPVTEKLRDVGARASARETVDGLFHLLTDLRCDDDVTVVAVRRLPRAA